MRGEVTTNQGSQRQRHINANNDNGLTDAYQNGLTVGQPSNHHCSLERKNVADDKKSSAEASRNDSSTDEASNNQTPQHVASNSSKILVVSQHRFNTIIDGIIHIRPIVLFQKHTYIDGTTPAALNLSLQRIDNRLSNIIRRYSYTKKCGDLSSKKKIVSCQYCQYFHRHLYSIYDDFLAQQCIWHRRRRIEPPTFTWTKHRCYRK